MGATRPIAGAGRVACRSAHARSSPGAPPRGTSPRAAARAPTSCGSRCRSWQRSSSSRSWRSSTSELRALDGSDPLVLPRRMNRRRLLTMLGIPGLAALGGAAYAATARGENPYYRGAVSDHFDGPRFFVRGRSTDKGFLELLRWHLGGGREDWPESYPSPFR